MLKSLPSLLAIFLLVSVSVFSSDLCLIEINSQEQLNQVSDILDNAHGTIDGKFIVYVNSSQSAKLQSTGLKAELLAKNCRLKDYYLVIKEHNKISKTALAPPSVYSTSRTQLVQMEKSSIEVLGRDGYIVFCLTEKNTPFYYHPPVYAAPALEDYPTDSLAALIDIDSLYSYILRLQNFYTRFTPSDSNYAARYWIKEKFHSFGYEDVSFQYFLATREWMGVVDEPAWNIICTKEGTERPDEYIIIGAHYDSYASNGLYDPAPGADDNASGVATVLEFARIFKDIDFKRTLLFVGFGAEEQWMDGSLHMAEEMYEDSADIELVANYDVISYEENGVYEYFITEVMQKTYAQVFLDAANRLENDLIPVKTNAPLDDDAMFHDLGWQSIAFFEYEFHPDMHTPYDLISSLDLEYMRQIIILGATAIPIIDAAPDPVVPYAYDMGDGQSLRIMWDSCFTDWSYKIMFGTNPSNLSDTIDVPSPECHYDIYGLTEGTEYYATVIGQPSGGYPSTAYLLTSETPQTIPRPPSDFSAEIDSNIIVLNWNANREIDFSHYKIIRKIPTGQWTVLEDNYTDTVYSDSQAEKYIDNFYIVLAYDEDMNESDSSETIIVTPATFDAGILLVDETQGGGENPSEGEQSGFYSSMFNGIPYSTEKIDSSDEALTRSTAGQYNPIFWVDDDDYNHVIGNSLDSLEWYFSYNTDFLLAGWSTIYSQTGQTYFYSGNFYYDQLGISYIAENPLTDFTGATGVDDWPDLELKPEAPGGGRLPNIDRFAATPEAEVICTFNSFSGNPAYDGKPVGVALDTYHGKRVVLGFPLYWLTEASAQALIARVMEFYAEESVLYGDFNGDWAINILDVTALIGYLYQDGEPPMDMNDGDPNGDCNINILDITYLIGYLYKSGPAPLEGCVT